MRLRQRAPHRLRIGYIAKAVSDDSAVVAVQTRWIRTLAESPQVESVVVMTPTLGPASFPDNVVVAPPYPGGRSRWATVVRLRFLLRFYRATAVALRAGVDCFFVAQGGPGPLLLAPVRLVLRKPVYWWKANPGASGRTRFMSRFCVDLVFTATPSSFPLDLPKKRVIGHGVDMTQFPLRSEAPRRDLVVLGRLTPAKGGTIAIDALAVHRDRYGVVPTLDFVGPVTDPAYLDELQGRARALGVHDAVRFCGPAAYDDMSDVIRRYRASINISGYALDKTAVEAMATGVPVLTTNQCTIEALPPSLLEDLVLREESADALAERVHHVLAWDDEERTRVGALLHDTAVRDHGLDGFFDKVLAEIEAGGVSRR
jgi:glycosyltransferase involved in cell wall biosynthesis